MKKKPLCEALKHPCDFFWSGWSENVGDWGLGNLLQCDHKSGRSPRQGIQNPGMDQHHSVIIFFTDNFIVAFLLFKIDIIYSHLCLPPSILEL